MQDMENALATYPGGNKRAKRAVFLGSTVLQILQSCEARQYRQQLKYLNIFRNVLIHLWPFLIHSNKKFGRIFCHGSTW